MRELALVAVCGALGSTARWAIKRFPLWPSAVVSTAFINLLGCFILGLLISMPLSREGRVAVAVGFLGALTTFSTFADDTLSLIATKQIGLALFNVVGQCTAGVAAVWLGNVLSRRLFGELF